MCGPDHKPLLSLLDPDRQTRQIPSQRVLRWNEFLNSYTYKLIYHPGKAMGHADTLSHLPLPQKDPAPAHHVMLLESLLERSLHAAEHRYLCRAPPDLMQQPQQEFIILLQVVVVVVVERQRKQERQPGVQWARSTMIDDKINARGLGIQQAGIVRGLMDTGSVTIFLRNISSTGVPASPSPERMSFLNLTLGIFILVSLLVGTIFNGLFLWVLGMKMKRTVNTLWFSHLIFTYLFFCTFLPFFAVYSFFGFRWVFGTLMCKVIIFLFSLTMFTTVFLLTIISLDRYLLICHPVWSQHNRTVPQARKFIVGVWLSSFVLSVPYMAFQETQATDSGGMKCTSNFVFSRDRDGPEMQTLRNRIHLALFVVRFLLAFLLPFLIITSCHCRMGWEMKKKRLVRNRKPFRVLVAAVASFFICWLPYHLYHSSTTHWESFRTMRQVLRVTMLVGECFNFCFTPILYLFVGEKFQQVFKTSLLALLKRGFMDIPIIPMDNVNANEVGHQTCSTGSLELKIGCGNNPPSP
ncbi:probable G-protein coupled receptor 33 [Heteronotia binoei]|uniref:probable G-protein coupled receptor 33 n=1 Tax=Heteronotia binoei TaxID=13085 RepID=UPI00292F8326|nr:probable G-protein coupled receptor 33 [Heteronotia binoei]